MGKYRQLTLSQRYQIQCLFQQKVSQKQIAAELGVHASTISRELSRNQSVSIRYDAIRAQDRYANHCKRVPYKIKGQLCKEIHARLKDFYSPEQISGVLARQAGQKRISHEAIYQYIYRGYRAGNSFLMCYLRLRHKKKYKKRGVPVKTGRIVGRVGIEHRPAIVDTNTEIGHWEADTVIGANHQGVLLTLVERKTKYTIIEKLPSKNAKLLAKQLIYRLKKSNLPAKTITFDNGLEFSAHKRIQRELKVNTYFANPYHSWERGLNENTNGLIRQYIPKSCFISGIKKSFVSWVETQLNNRPRKTLEFLSPVQVVASQ